MTQPADDRIWIDLTDFELHQAFDFYVPKFPLKTLHSLPLTEADGSPTQWADLPKRWAKGIARELYVRQAWRHADRGGDPLLDPFCYSAGIDHQVKATRVAAGLPPLPNHVGSWSPPATMPPSACRSRLLVRDWCRRSLQSIVSNDAIDHGIWRGDVGTDPNRPIQGYRREAFAGETRDTPAEAFRDAWNSVHGAGAWERNPEVLTIQFRAKAMFYTHYSAGARERIGLGEAA